MSERVEICGMAVIVVETMPDDVLFIVPKLLRKIGESDQQFDLRRAKASVKLINTEPRK